MVVCCDQNVPPALKLIWIRPLQSHFKKRCALCANWPKTTLRRKSRILPKWTQWILFFPQCLLGLLSFSVKPKTSGSYCHNHFQRPKIFQRTRWHFTIARSKYTQPRLIEPAQCQWKLESFWKLGPGESDSHKFKPASTRIVRLVTAGIKRKTMPFTDTCIT